jgi:hypothetical protein
VFNFSLGQREPCADIGIFVSNLEKTYGTTVLKDLREGIATDGSGETFEDVVTLWDTRIKGRPNLEKLIPELFETLNMPFECVFATSNPQGTAEIRRGCAKQGIACFGPVWDS